MKFNKKHFWAIAFVVLVIVVAIMFVFIPKNTPKTIEVSNSSYNPVKFDVNDYELPSYLWKDLGYDSVIACYEDLVTKREEAVGAADDAIEVYSSVITDEEKELLKSYESKMANALTIVKYNEYLDLFNEVTDELDMRMPTASYSGSSGGSPGSSGEYYSSNGSGLTRSGGINFYNGRKETYYSSNVLYHYKTPQWTVGNDGVYRDADGYVVVAASDLPYGSIVDTSFGAGRVLDSGCPSGVSDIYTNW
nr:MAG TPA: hypothetical protein [Caudoviricetes sp.]